MKITLFAKTAHTKDGKAFIRYPGALRKYPVHEKSTPL